MGWEHWDISLQSINKFQFKTFSSLLGLEKVARALIEKGYINQISSKDSYGDTPLHEAVSHGTFLKLVQTRKLKNKCNKFVF